jgi:hypothetical protein
VSKSVITGVDIQGTPIFNCITDLGAYGSLLGIHVEYTGTVQVEHDSTDPEQVGQMARVSFSAIPLSESRNSSGMAL